MHDRMIPTKVVSECVSFYKSFQKQVNQTIIIVNTVLIIGNSRKKSFSILAILPHCKTNTTCLAYYITLSLLSLSLPQVQIKHLVMYVLCVVWRSTRNVNFQEEQETSKDWKRRTEHDDDDDGIHHQKKKICRKLSLES